MIIHDLQLSKLIHCTAWGYDSCKVKKAIIGSFNKIDGNVKDDVLHATEWFIPKQREWRAFSPNHFHIFMTTFTHEVVKDTGSI